MELVGYEDVEARSHEALDSLVVHKVNSDYDIYFIYEVGKVIEVNGYDDNRWNECSAGIHFFITREEAVTY